MARRNDGRSWPFGWPPKSEDGAQREVVGQNAKELFWETWPAGTPFNEQVLMFDRPGFVFVEIASRGCHRPNASTIYPCHRESREGLAGYGTYKPLHAAGTRWLKSGVSNRTNFSRSGKLAHDTAAYINPDT